MCDVVEQFTFIVNHKTTKNEKKKISKCEMSFFSLENKLNFRLLEYGLILMCAIFFSCIFYRYFQSKIVSGM